MPRKLRSGTRRNYKQLAAGEDRVSSECEEKMDDECGFSSKILGKELTEMDSGDEGSNESDMVETTDDEDLDKAERRLSKLKKMKEKLEKEETEKKKKVSNNRKKLKKDHKVTIGSLRKMEDVMEEVDLLMDKNNLGNQKQKEKKKDRSRRKKDVYSSDSFLSSSGEESTDSSSTGSSYSSDSSPDRKERRKKHSGRRSTKKSGKRSGKSKKLTSYVKYPQEWPHTHLSLHFVSTDKRYEQLSIQEFCAGYAAILEMSSGKKNSDLKYRLSHFKELMYLATKFSWDCVLNYHAAVLLEIERGHCRWGDSFQMLQTTTLAGGYLLHSNNNSYGTLPQKSMKNAQDGPVIFCKSFQRGACQEETDHFGDFNGMNRYLRHICGNCWLQLRKKAPHPESSGDCPFNANDV